MTAIGASGRTGQLRGDPVRPMRRFAAIALGAVGVLLHAPAAAQLPVDAGVEVATDERRRGLSWSGGDAVIAADVSIATAGVRVSARAVTTRGSPRHGGADAALDLGLAYRRPLGPIELEGRVRGHLFADGAGPLDYVEVGASGLYTLGPVQLDVGVDYAPDQRALGGSNLYLSAGASAGIPVTPFTLTASVGRSSGNTDDPLRAARLRPAGTYLDWRLGVERVTGPLTLALDYTDTDIDQRAPVSPFADRRHAGSRLTARARVSF